jgi:hypothetical protein
MSIDQEPLPARQMQIIGKLSQAVAHDINNLLAGIVGYAEIMQEESASNLKPHIEEIRKASRRISSLTRLLLIFRNCDYIADTLDLNNLILELQKYIPILIGPKIRFRASLQPELWAVKVDPIQIKRLLMIMAADLPSRVADSGNFEIKTQNISLPDISINAISLDPGRYVRMTAMISYGIPAAYPTLTREAYLDYLGISDIAKLCGGHAFYIDQSKESSSIDIYLPAVDTLVPA